MKQEGVLRLEHFDALVVQQIRCMERKAVDLALHQLRNKSQEKMRGVRFMSAYLASFFRTAVGQSF
jgi:hypothetical protein